MRPSFVLILLITLIGHCVAHVSAHFHHKWALWQSSFGWEWGSAGHRDHDTQHRAGETQSRAARDTQPVA
jgi:hypothetical protein